ncbi:leucine-rich repeat protein [Mahella australiensis]|uniref:Uncharacterized protein n=1 Tax=Mahella australiensis (strain DSM 15567 / CIP 107919 / 50-1 BON) TaxID=697281 RepID=F3ZWV8_MAHA5|nr:leucine-rich repeat protein [Mahella australiensis]AEE97580.1 hypothetical protein Mahau_2417 [Mahella australiensis 50-1 BON]
MHFNRRKLLAYVLCITVLLSGMFFVEVRTTSAADPTMLYYAEGDVWIDTDGNEMTPEHARLWRYYVLNNGTGTVGLAWYLGDIVDGRIVGKVPASINGKPVSTMDSTFRMQPLEYAPVIPDTVTNMVYTFAGCTSLIEAPVIPDTVTNMSYTFYECTSLTELPAIPDKVIYMLYAFYDCTNITGIIKIPVGAISTSYFADSTLDRTTKPILLLYTSSQSSLANMIHLSNVTKRVVPSTSGYNKSLPQNIMDTDTRVTVDIESLTGVYELSTGEELNFTATVSNPDLQYKWVVQDLYDTNGETNYNASIDSTGKLKAFQDGFAAVGLMAKFPDNTEHVYGAKVVKITNGGNQPVTSGFVSIQPGDTLASWSDDYSMSGSLGQYFSLPHDGIIVSQNNPPSGDEQALYEPSIVTGNIVDKSVNYLKVGETASYQVANLNPADASYRFVARSMVQPASVSITDTGEVKAQSAGLSIILLVDSQNKLIDKLPIMVGENDVISPEEQEQLDNASLDPDDYSYMAIGDGEYDVIILGNIEPITTLDVDVPISINFVIDRNRLFKAPVIKLVSHCAAPLKVSINNVSTVGDSPSLVDPATYTDAGWLSLGEADTRSKIGLILNGVGLYRKSGLIGTIPSAFNGEKDLDLALSAKYGKSWGNMAGKNIQYNVELLIEMQ